MAQSGNQKRSAADRWQSLPSGDDIASFQSYQEAKNAIGTLLEGGVPAKALSIVGDNLSSVERITARYGYGRAALSSALTGSWIGLFVGLIVVTLGIDMTLAPLAAGIVIGAGGGMIVGMLLFSSQRQNRPTFRSMQQVIATTYRVVVDYEHHGKARRLLDTADGQ